MKKWLDKYEAPKAQVGTMLAPITGEDVSKFFDMFSVPQKAVTKMVTGKYQTPSEAMNIKNPVGAFATDMILDPINLIGAGAVKTSGAYKNAYKLNPWAFKPNPEAAYRMIGKEGYEDALKSGYLKPSTKGSDIGKVHTTTHYQIGVPSDRRMYSGRYWSRGYDGPYMAEVPNATTNPKFSYGPGGKGVGAEAMTYPENYVPVSEANIYKQDWLRGYKKVSKSKKKAQNGIEGTMGGLTDVGFNYNGAWGGTMQMGGAMPGAVGFTYARTAGAAPANGPYAKKTKASAQDGTYVKKPLVKLSPDELKMERLKQYAQRASKKEQPIVQPRGSMSDAARKQLYEDAQRSELKNQFLRTADVATDLMQFGNFVPNPVGQAIGTAGNILGGWVDSYQAYDAYNKGNYGDAAINAASVALPMGLGSSTFRRNSKYLKPGQPLYPLSPQANLPASSINAPRVNYIEPFTKVKGMTDANLLANRALLGTLGAETAYDTFQNGGEMKYYQEGLDFKPKTISQDGSKTPKKKKTLILAEHDPEYWNNPDGSFSDRHINPFMTEAAGIKKYVNKYFPNEDVEIIPTYKQNIKEVLTKSDPNTRLVVMGHHGDKMFGIPSSEFVESIGNTKYENCYAGICYGDDLPGIGRPSSEPTLTYLSRREDDQNKKITTRYPESYNLNNFHVRTNNLGWLGFAPVDRGGEEGFKDSFFRRTKNPEIIKLQNQIRNIWDDSKDDYNVKSRKAAPIEAQLNKLYKKGEAVNMPKAVNTKELDYVPLPGRVYNYNDPLQFNPQRILQKKEQGGSIISPLGQWAYPGEITTIPSNQITMQGVPYPVLGISDIGDVQMMYPGEDYTFDGEYVTEYPMAKGGISVNKADAQPIKKLDQLLNFTNYNKPTKGGWLDKYQ